MAAKKTWKEKLEANKELPKVEAIDEKMSKRWGTGTVVIPNPMEVDGIMRQIPEGKLITINEIRAMLATRHNATIACPMTTGIFAWVAAHAANEDAAKGATGTNPFWRTLKSGGELNEKYPGGIEYAKVMLELEGHRVIQKGKRYFVADYEKSLAEI